MKFLLFENYPKKIIQNTETVFCLKSYNKINLTVPKKELKVM